MSNQALQKTVLGFPGGAVGKTLPANAGDEFNSRSGEVRLRRPAACAPPATRRATAVRRPHAATGSRSAQPGTATYSREDLEFSIARVSEKTKEEV